MPCVLFPSSCLASSQKVCQSTLSVLAFALSSHDPTCLLSAPDPGWQHLLVSQYRQQAVFALSHKPSSLTCERNIMIACCYHAECVCAGLEEAVQTMKLHEVAEVVVQPQYGYGSEEHQTPETTIPANSTLFYTVELTDLSKVCACSHPPIHTSMHPTIHASIHPSSLSVYLYVYAAQGFVYRSPCCCQVSLLLTATTMYDMSCKYIGDFSGLTVVVLEEGKKKTNPLGSTIQESVFASVMHPIKLQPEHVLIRYVPCMLQPKEGYEMGNSEKLDEAKKRKDAGNDLFKQAK